MVGFAILSRIVSFFISKKARIREYGLPLVMRLSRRDPEPKFIPFSLRLCKMLQVWDAYLIPCSIDVNWHRFGWDPIESCTENSRQNRCPFREDGIRSTRFLLVVHVPSSRDLLRAHNETSSLAMSGFLDLE